MANSNVCDWRDDKSLSECMLHMLKNEIMCDVSLKLGENQDQIKAHKYMLSSRSPVFHAMFDGSLPETGDIKIPDIDMTTFQTLLRYIYGDVVDISNGNVQELLYAAEKYMIPRLKRECEKHLDKTSQSEHAPKAFHTAFKYHLDELQQKSFRYIEMNTTKCLTSEFALVLPKECVELILKSDILDCSETDVCSFVLKWAKKECSNTNQEATGKKLREIVGSLLYLVRFPVVDMEFFTKEVSETGFLTLEEVVSIYQSKFGKQTSFSKTPRCSVAKRETHTLIRYGNVSNPWSNEGIEALIFQTNEDFWLKGVCIFGIVGFRFRQKASLTIQIWDDENHELLSNIFNVDFDNNQTMQLILKDTTHILTGKKHTIQIEGLPENTCYGTLCQDSPSCKGVTVTFQNSPKCTTGTNTIQGQIAGLLFSL